MKLSFVRSKLFYATILVIANTGLAQPTNFAATLADLRTQLDTHLNQPRFEGALWGVKIVALKTGKTIFEHHAARLMSPASNSKLYAGALALTTFGGDYQISTPISSTARVERNGTIHGDLIVSGRGDPSWKNTNFWDNFAPFVAALKNAGVRRITGDLIADDTFFQGEPYGGGWAVDDLTDAEGGEISALTLDDNVITLRVLPGKKVSEACAAEFLLPESGILLVNQTKTIATGGTNHFEIHRAPGERKIILLGEMSLGSAPETLETPVPSPAIWFGNALKTALIKNGVSVRGKVRSVAWPEKPLWNQANLTLLGEVKSPPLRSLLRAFMKPSQNLETDLIFAHTGESFRPPESPTWLTTEDLAVAALQHFLTTYGVPPDLHFDEGSGLSRNNLTSANATVALLTLMATNRYAADYFEALPIAGVDGTLRRRMKNTPAFQNVHAKTGTLRWVNALSGYVTTASGETLVFSLMLNRYSPPRDRKRTDELDDIAVMLAGFKGRLEE